MHTGKFRQQLLKVPFKIFLKIIFIVSSKMVWFQSKNNLDFFSL